MGIGACAPSGGVVSRMDIVRAVCVVVALTFSSAESSRAADVRGRIEIQISGRSQQHASINAYPGTLGSLQVRHEAPVLNDPRDVAISLHGAPEPGQSSRAKNPRIEQANQRFNPRVLAVPVGTTVEFPNLDPIFHNAFSYSKTKRFDLGKYGQGKSESVTFDKPGVVKVFCDIHSNMSAYVYVSSSRRVTKPDADGHFELRDVPEGEYTLLLWHPELGAREQTVTVADPETTVEICF